jgi:hypothetical protein
MGEESVFYVEAHVLTNISTTIGRPIPLLIRLLYLLTWRRFATPKWNSGKYAHAIKLLSYVYLGPSIRTNSTNAHLEITHSSYFIWALDASKPAFLPILYDSHDKSM